MEHIVQISNQIEEISEVFDGNQGKKISTETDNRTEEKTKWNPEITDTVEISWSKSHHFLCAHI